MTAASQYSLRRTALKNGSFLIEVLEGDKVIASRKSKHAYEAASVTRWNRAWNLANDRKALRYFQQELSRYEKAISDGGGEDYERYAANTRQHIADTEAKIERVLSMMANGEQFPAGVYGYSRSASQAFKSASKEHLDIIAIATIPAEENLIRRVWGEG